jgi:hypothetical protein
VLDSRLLGNEGTDGRRKGVHLWASLCSLSPALERPACIKGEGARRWGRSPVHLVLRCERRRDVSALDLASRGPRE